MDLISKYIHATDTTRQQIPIMGLTTNQAIPIVINQTTIVKARAMMLVQTQIIFAKNGITFAKISTNWNIMANQQYISISQINLIIQVIILFDFCADKNMSSALIFHCCSNDILLPLETVYAVRLFHCCFHTILIIQVLTEENVIFKSQMFGLAGSSQI